MKYYLNKILGLKNIIARLKLESLFFSLMKRTKNQGCVIVVKAQISIL
jgi:hypothetical protein